MEFYWYDYLGFEAGPNGGVSAAAGLANLSITGEAELLLGVYIGDEPPNPNQVAGLAGSLDVNIKANIWAGADLGGGVTYGGGWLFFNLTLGVGLNSTPEASAAVSPRVIFSGVIQPVIPTKNRSFSDMFSNHSKHILPLIF